MENLNQIGVRVDSYLAGRLKRWASHIVALCVDPRDPRGTRHTFVDCVVGLLAGIVCQRSGIRDVEELSAKLGLGSRAQGISDGAFTHLLTLCQERQFELVLVNSVRDMGRRGELRHPGFCQSWISVDGKYSCLDHDCGGWGQKFFKDKPKPKEKTKPKEKKMVKAKMQVETKATAKTATATATNETVPYWRVGVLRAVLITSPSRPALGQWPMGPVKTEETDPEKVKHTGEITNLPPFIGWLRKQFGELASNFSLDAGLWSKAIFLAMDLAGMGVLCALKENKPELYAEVERIMRIEMEKRAPVAESDWEPCRTGTIRRRLWRTDKLDGWLGWKNLRQVAVVEQTTRDHDGKETVELRYYITNATTGMLSARQLLQLIRQHWAIENDCNWTFDMQFGEDDLAYCAQNKALLVLGVLRMIAYNLLQHLRKSHATVQHARIEPTPRPWRSLFELVHDRFKTMGTGFAIAITQAADTTVRTRRRRQPVPVG